MLDVSEQKKDKVLVDPLSTLEKISLFLLVMSCIALIISGVFSVFGIIKLPLLIMEPVELLLHTTLNSAEVGAALFFIGGISIVMIGWYHQLRCAAFSKSIEQNICSSPPSSLSASRKKTEEKQTESKRKKIQESHKQSNLPSTTPELRQ